MNSMDKYTQGTIIQFIRSKKYPGIKCYGVVITARCDIANNKISQIHCLSALGIRDFIFEVLFEEAVEKKRRDLNGKIYKLSKERALSYDVLVDKGLSNTCRILDMIIKSSGSSLKKSDKSNIESIIKECSAVIELESCKDRAQKESHFKAVQSIILADMKRLHNSNLPNYCFLPNKSFDGSDSLLDGIVADLRDIYSYDCGLVEKVVDGQIDVRTMEKDYIERNNEYFFLENDGYALALDVVKSPWIEHLVQAFAYSFARVGVDNASQEEVDGYFEQYLEK